jgi:hypothetical protein
MTSPVWIQGGLEEGVNNGQSAEIENVMQRKVVKGLDAWWLAPSWVEQIAGRYCPGGRTPAPEAPWRLLSIYI